MKIKYFEKVLSLAILSVTVFLILAPSYFRLFDSYELETLDFRFWLRPKIETTDKVAIIEIGDDTIKKIGRFPFDRSYHALLIKALSEAGAKAIVFDIFFSEPHKNDRELEDAMRVSGNVYLPFVLEIQSANRDHIPVASGYIAKELDNFTMLARGVGHINVIPDIDGKFRRTPLYIKYGNALYPSLSFLAVCDYLGIREKDVRLLPGKYITCGPDIKIPLDEDSNIIVNFSGGWGRSYSHYSYADILQSYFAKFSGSQPILNLAAFKDKVCIIGLTAVGTSDLHPTPFEPLYPAVGIHAEIFNSILTRNFIERASRLMNILMLLFLTSLISLAAFKVKPLKGLFVLLGTSIIFAIASVILFNFYGIWIDLLYPALVMAIVYLSCTLFKYVMEWKRRLVMENELAIAKKIQESFLPKKLPSIETIDVAATMFTAKQVGGDLYDFVEFDSESIGVMIGDVSGKGVPASLFMAMVTGAFRSFAMPKSRPEEVLSNLNSKLIRESSSNLFVTIFYSIFDFKNKTMSYANGGHLPLLYLGKDRPVEFLDVKEGAPLGLMEGAYSGSVINFSEGDIFVFYTDGITEAMNSRQEMYGKEALEAVVEKNKTASAKALVGAIEKDVRRFESKTKQHDDMTIIVVRMI